MALTILLENKEKTHIASPLRSVYAVITEFMLITDMTFSTQFFNFTTKYILLRFPQMLTRTLTSAKPAKIDHLPF